MIPQKLLDEISRWIRDKKYGNIQINFSGGKIVNVNRTESFKVDNLLGIAVNVSSTIEKPIEG
jgi:hypothetical protein